MNKENNTISTFDNIKNEVLDSIDSFIYAKDLSGKYTYANQALLDLFEKKLADVIGFDDSHFYDLVISKQLKINDDLVMNKAIRVESEEKNFIKAKNETRIYKVVKKPLYRSDGSVDGMSGISTDITAEKKLQEQISNQSYLLATMLNNIDAHIYVKDCERTFLYVNSRVAELFGDKAENIMGKKDTEILPKEIAEHFYQSDKQVFETNKKQVIEETTHHEDGDTFHYISTKIPFNQPDRLPALIGFSSDVTELYKLKEEFKNLANTDPLTNLYNRRYLTEQAEQEYHRAKRYSLSLTVMTIDIDHFKSINDKFGHPAGDKVLIAVAQQLKTNLRKIDILARIGGEEFSILLPETSATAGMKLAERIRTEQSNLKIVGDWPGEIKLSVSIGVSSFLSDDESFDTMFSRADKALYQAKNYSRNKVMYL
ncbi:diguanylate cyclase [Colwellia sp. MB02u-18]|uniref:sensor domain-containing diguanylate cyclase n=1 Tax=unclassified Colwellia TaxID=196834 RepID=UPI0015F55368|nr:MULTISPECIES: diguanylate cyclase [unclassified Colwellia]MBA6224059.1 diguanylate cyclase [Colwellia sp. MB3u-45]MBA6269049.1 diguanylate cyclase [Colwellia sp. MB3u-43]MBA6320865.1 diguanylate cyclase [Colwellia sp. MB02u-19]MBA6324145.1 diguanylate cyclase [Colwellia sp. MB02u-18]MBA6332694.1 diguanylate cyclase [Colwellia sp. MB02u-12]